MPHAALFRSILIATIAFGWSSARSFAAEPAVPEGVTFEKGIEYANPDNQHLQLNMARPAKGEGPVSVIVSIH